MAFTQKLLTATVGGITLSGLRMSLDMLQTGAVAGSTLVQPLLIYGMTKSQMNQLTDVGRVWNNFENGKTLTISAGDGQTGMSMIFNGTILHAHIDAMNQPQVRFVIFATQSVVQARQIKKVITQQGAVQADSLFQRIAQSMGLSLENNGVNNVIRNPYLWGTDITKCRHLAQACSAEWFIDGVRGKLAIWPAGGSRNVGSTPLISKQTGMVASPLVDRNNIIVKTLFNPQVVFGDKVQVYSEIVEAANATWNISSIDFELDSMVPRGRWFQTIRGVDPATSGGGSSSEDAQVPAGDQDA